MSEDIGWRKYSDRFRTYPMLIPEPFDPSVRMIVCVPVCAEPELNSTLIALFNGNGPIVKTEVILLFNKNYRMSDDEIEIHIQSWKNCVEWIALHKKDNLVFLPFYLEELPDPKGGVGWARKIVMDEAARRLNPDGIIICLDADCTVSENYLNSIYQHFNEFKTQHAVSIFYEHKLDELLPTQKDAIIIYELHLRYLINAQQWTGHPYAFSTVGSAMAVRRKAYMEQGGMNTRSAGEDFYFLQKFIEIGTHGEIRDTTVYPSARISSRVPFGTGRAMQQILTDSEPWLTTDFQIFHHIKPLFHSVDKVRDFCILPAKEDDYQELQSMLDLSTELITYLKHIGFLEECRLIAKQTASINAFRKRFFRYFNAFRMIKYMHYMRDNFYPNVLVLLASSQLAEELKLADQPLHHENDYLQILRQYDRKK